MRKGSREYKKRIKQLYALHYFKFSDILRCRLYGKLEEVNMELDVNTESYLVIQRISRNSFSSEKTIQACIKAYYLYELLIQKEGLEEWILNEEIRESLEVSNETLIKIRNVFSYFGFIKVETSEYAKSIRGSYGRKKSKLDHKRPRIIPYKYKPGSFIYEGMSSACALVRRTAELRGNKIKVRFKLSKKLYDIIEVKNKLTRCEKVGDIFNILLRFLKA